MREIVVALSTLGRRGAFGTESMLQGSARPSRPSSAEVTIGFLAKRSLSRWLGTSAFALLAKNSE